MEMVAQAVLEVLAGLIEVRLEEGERVDSEAAVDAEGMVEVEVVGSALVFTAL